MIKRLTAALAITGIVAFTMLWVTYATKPEACGNQPVSWLGDRHGRIQICQDGRVFFQKAGSTEWHYEGMAP